jgi:hypothetical protein
MSVMHCPHCGAENFTMEGWEDLDHCSSCDKPLGEPVSGPIDAAAYATQEVAGRERHQGSKGKKARKPRRA